MKRLSRFLVVAALVGLVASTLALAYDGIGKPYMPKMRLGQPYDRSIIMSRQDDRYASVPMPTPVDDPATGGAIGALSSESTATGSAALDDMMRGSSVLPATGGMPMASPKERADREVRRLIRALD